MAALKMKSMTTMVMRTMTMKMTRTTTMMMKIMVVDYSTMIMSGDD